MRYFFARYVFLALLSISLLGCAVKLPTISNYVLAFPLEKIAYPSFTKTNYTLFLATMSANPGYTTSSMIYVLHPSDLQSFATHQWTAPPAQMLLPLVAQQIESTGYFHAVIMPPFNDNTDFRLETRLVVLQQEFMQPVSQVRCIIQAFLLNSHTHRILATQRFQIVVPAPGNNPYSGVMAADQAAYQLSVALANFAIANTHK